MRKLLDLYVTRRGCPAGEAYAELSLPAAPYELLGAMDRVRPERPSELDYSVEDYHGCSFLAPHLRAVPNLFTLNALCGKLAQLDERQIVAFHGLVQMEARKGAGPLPARRLLDLAYSADCCHVVDALDDGQLGRFYADNGFVPEVEDLPDRLYDLLDFAEISRKARTAEGGVFVQSGRDDPGGYVLRHSELMEAPPAPTGPPEQPDYVFRLLLTALPRRQRYEYLDLPASAEQIWEAARRTGADSLSAASAAVLDGPLDCMREGILDGAELLTVNDLAERIASLDANGLLPRFKAVLEATEYTEPERLLDLTGRMEDYRFEPDKRGAEDVALDELRAAVGGGALDAMARHMDLYAYGAELLERDNAVVTHYGFLARKDGQPVQAPVEQAHGQGGMEML